MSLLECCKKNRTSTLILYPKNGVSQEDEDRYLIRGAKAVLELIQKKDDETLLRVVKAYKEGLPCHQSVFLFNPILYDFEHIRANGFSSGEKTVPIDYFPISSIFKWQYTTYFHDFLHSAWVHDLCIDREMYRQFWRELRRTVQFGKGLSYKNRIFWDSDYSDPRIAKKYGVKWDEISEHFLKYGSTSGARIPVSYSDDPDSTSENDEASEWLWDFYRRGLPPKPNALKQWKNALEHLIEYKQSQQDQQYSNEDDYVPF